MIIQALNARQKKRGYLTKEDMRSVASELQVALHQVEALVTFFPHYRETPPPKVEVHVCRDMACHLRGSAQVIDQLSKWAAAQPEHACHVSGVSCLGRCDRAPAAMVNEQLFVERTADQLQAIAEQTMAGEMPPCNLDWELARSKVGTWQIECYAEGRSTYDVVRTYLNNQDPSGVFEILKTANLLGMGGAGGRTYLKWKDVYEARGSTSDKYIVCNADESEPGTFKDRDLLLAAPHLTIEGMILAALVTGARQGWVYIRHEYPEQAQALEREIKRAEALGALGEDIFGSGRNFKLEVFVSPGNYICGEQTALIEAMEDKRAEPRIRPPELMTNGYKNQPTLLNNVETFAWVPAIMMRSDGQWYAGQGRKSGAWIGDNSDKMNGMRFFSVSGDVARPGAYEVPTGIPLGELIDDYCGGMAHGKQLAVVALSGPSGGLLPGRIPINTLPKEFVQKYVKKKVTALDVRNIPLDINVARSLGIMIGAGIVVYGSGVNILEQATVLSRFFRNESCGKCVPCRIGSQKITQVCERMADGKMTIHELESARHDMIELAEVMKATSICGLGQVASNPLHSLLRYFPEYLESVCRGATAGASDRYRSSEGGGEDSWSFNGSEDLDNG